MKLRVYVYLARVQRCVPVCDKVDKIEASVESCSNEPHACVCQDFTIWQAASVFGC